MNIHPAITFILGIITTYIVTKGLDSVFNHKGFKPRVFAFLRMSADVYLWIWAAYVVFMYFIHPTSLINQIALGFAVSVWATLRYSAYLIQEQAAIHNKKTIPKETTE